MVFCLDVQVITFLLGRMSAILIFNLLVFLLFSKTVLISLYRPLFFFNWDSCLLRSWSSLQMKSVPLYAAMINISLFLYSRLSCCYSIPCSRFVLLLAILCMPCSRPYLMTLIACSCLSIVLLCWSQSVYIAGDISRVYLNIKQFHTYEFWQVMSPDNAQHHCEELYPLNTTLRQTLSIFSGFDNVNHRGDQNL